ncbi:MAG: hypothetical protein ACI85O_003367 [Saprospiraceae bacterium]|jgi:hypothetical protein
MKNLILVFLAVSSIGFTRCNVNKRLAPFTSALEQAANSDMSPDKKMEILATTTTKALRESLVFINPKKTGQFIDRFAKQNEKSIGKIIQSLEGNVKGMSLVEKIGFFAKTTKKPYIKELKAEAKKVEKKAGRKMKTYGMIGKFLSFLNPLKG